jgi:hypothetical protein
MMSEPGPLSPVGTVPTSRRFGFGPSKQAAVLRGEAQAAICHSKTARSDGLLR